MSLLEVRNVTLKFGGVIAVNNVSFDVEQGEVFALVGPNGAGKSTLFNLISRFYDPVEGEIILDASGSMLQRQNGERRIEIARRTLARLVADTIPAGTGFALRVFGNREADACRSDLEIPLGPLDVAAASAVINAITDAIGVRDLAMPASPARVWQAIQSAKH